MKRFLIAFGLVALGLVALPTSTLAQRKLPAGAVGITDSSGHFTATDVEAALAELGLRDYQIYNILDQGAVCDSSSGSDPATNVTAIHAAIDAAAAEINGSGAVLIPCQIYVNDTINVDENGIALLGFGPNASTIYTVSDTANGIYVAPTDPTSTNISAVTIAGLTLSKTPSACPFTQTCSGITGIGLWVENPTRVNVSNMYISRYPNGNILVEGGQFTNFSEINLGGGSPNGAKIASAANVLLQAGTGNTQPTIYNVNMDNFSVSGNHYDYGIQITSADGSNFSNFYLNFADTAGIWINPAASTNLGGLSFSNFYLDSGPTQGDMDTGILISGSGTGASVMFTNGQMYNQDDGVLTTLADYTDIHFNNIRMVGVTSCYDLSGAAGQDGSSYRIADSSCMGNNTGADVPTTGITATPLESLIVNGNHINSVSGTAVALTSGNITNAIISNNIVNDAGTAYSNAATVTDLRVCGNIGIDSVNCDSEYISTSGDDLVFNPVDRIYFQRNGSTVGTIRDYSGVPSMEFGVSSSHSIGDANGSFRLFGDSYGTSKMLFGATNGTQVPSLHFGKSRRTAWTDGASIVFNNDSLGNINFYGDDGTNMSTPGASIRARVDGTPSADNMPTELVFQTNTNSAYAIDRLIISPTGSLQLKNADSAPSSQANSVMIYAEDVSASSELKVRDEAGNVTTLSPHNFSLIGEPSEEMAWSFYSERDGNAINVDMLRAFRLLEEMSGEKLVYIKEIDNEH